MRAPVCSERCVAVPGIAECEGELLSCRLCRKPALTQQGGELAGCGWHGTVLPAEGSVVPVRCRGTQAGQCGKWVLSCHRPQRDLGWQHSRAWQISTLETTSFKTWTQVIKTQSILWGEGHKDPSEYGDGEGALTEDTTCSLLPSPLAREAF